MNKCCCKCNAALDIKLVSGVADTSNPIRIGMHSRGCCVKMGVDTESYEWEGKEVWSPKEIGWPVNLLKWRRRIRILTFLRRDLNRLDVKEEMKIRISVLAVSNMTRLPKQVHDTCRSEIDQKYVSGWSGIVYQSAIDLVRNTRRHLNFGDAISTVENVPEYNQMTDSKRSFLQVSMSFPNPVDGEDPI